jgi:putative addiction module component (TIGR02574 family)
MFSGFLMHNPHEKCLKFLLWASSNCLNKTTFGLIFYYNKNRTSKMTAENQNSVESIKKLSVAERILIVEDIWDSIISSNEQHPISDEQKKELDSRLKSHLENPNDVKSWDEVRKNITSQL